jgi:tetratricopeptide (TPR) repeat protein
VGIFDSDVPAALEDDVKATEEALVLARQLGDRGLEIGALLEKGRALLLLERTDEALVIAEECLALAREHGNPDLLGRAHSHVGQAVKGFLAAAGRPHHLDALACFREAGNRVLECTELMMVGITGWENLDDVAEGCAVLEQAQELAELTGSTAQLVYLWGNLAIGYAILDEYEAAEDYCRRNLRAVKRLGMTRGFLTFDMLVMSHVAAGIGDPAVAAQLAGASNALWNAVARPAEFHLTRMELDLIARNDAGLADTLGEAEFQRLFALGQQLSVDQALDLALGRVPIAA